MEDINCSMGQLSSSPVEFNDSFTGSVPDIQTEVILEESKETITNDSVICLDDDEDEYILPELPVIFPPENEASKDIKASNEDDDFCIVYEKVVPPSDIQIVLTETEALIKNKRKKHKLQTNSNSSDQNGSTEIINENEGQESSIDDSVIIIDDQCTTSHSSKTTLRQALIDSAEKKKRKVECAVCFDGPDEITRTGRNLMSTFCGHIFCDECIKETMKVRKQCPQCRKKLTAKQYHPIYL